MIKHLKNIVVGFLLIIFAVSCKKESNTINLFYTINYDGDSWENHRTGLIWALSYLGATLPKDTFDVAIKWKDATSFCLNLEKIGFNQKSLKALQIINQKMMKSESYKQHQAIDIGQFIALTVGSSWHYYEITSMPKSLQEFYALKDTFGCKVFPVTNSTVAKHHRRLRYYTSSAKPHEWLFLAEEGFGNLINNTFQTEVTEVFDIMANGQLRFGIYDKKGKLISASPLVFGEAGKPAKCLWCHEIAVAPLFKKTNDLPGFMNSENFNKDMASLMERLSALRKQLNSDIDFKKTQDHTQMELLYISYINPSLRRLAQEWHLTIEETAQIVKSKTRTNNKEFGFLGDLYIRKDLDYLNSIFPESIREMNDKEINFFK